MTSAKDTAEEGQVKEAMRYLHWYDLPAAALIVGMSVLLALNTKDYLERPAAPVNPLSYEVPQPIIGPDVIKVGGVLKIQRVKCNRSDVPVAVQSQGSFYRRVEPTGLYIASQPAGNAIVINAHDCDTATFSGALPEAVTPGIWVRQGIDCVVDQLTRWCASWSTERFTVVP